MSLYAADGSWNVSVVTGSVYTGLYAADGSVNVVAAPGGIYVGAYHPCGAWYVTLAPSPSVGSNPLRAPDGSLYVSETPYTNGGIRVTVVSGSLITNPPTGFTLTDVTSGRLFQRTKALTTGPTTASGTYTGGTPSAIELQVRLTSNNSIVKSWTTGTSNIAGGNWSSTITGVPQGGSYYIEARPSNATNLAQTGSNPFYVGMMFVLYGQSNMLNMSSRSSSPPAALAGTTYFNGTTWVAVPGGNGVRELLNDVFTATGIPCAALNGGVSGVPIVSLSKGQTAYTNLAAQITSATNDFEMIVWHQGEGDAALNTPQATYLASLSQLHSDLVTDYGRTKAQAPLVLAGLAFATLGYTDAGWDAMERTLLDAPITNTNTYYSHSNRDATLFAGDSVHWDGASYGRAGKRYARSISTILGVTSGFPNWHIDSADVVDATTTTVDVLHGLGTDFTPASGITGFDISGDNGANWDAATGVHTTATQITLTHPSASTTSSRKLRYQYGVNPDASAPVLDNSSLALPLDNSAGNISPTPLAALPVITFASSGQNTGNGITQTRTGIAVPGSSEPLLVIVGVHAAAQVRASTCTVTAQPSATPVSATLVDTNALNADRLAGIYQAEVPSGTTSVDLSITYNTSPFIPTRSSVSTIPVASLNSTTPVGSGKAATGSALSVSCNIPTTSGGVIFTVATNESTTAGNTTVFSGTETFATRNSAIAQGGTMGVGDASNVATNASSTVTATWGNADLNSICAASWR